MEEIVVNLHMHTRYSDGNADHGEIARAALRAGIDAVIVTDHNVHVAGPEGYYNDGERRVLLLVGEEIHDRTLLPQKNHLLVFGHNCELAPLAHDTHRLLEAVARAGGVSFLAHPNDPSAPIFGETDITWENWDVQGYTGIELWNAMSEFKGLLRSKLHAAYYALNPERIACGPFPQTLARWDALLAVGRRVAAVGGSDAHALPGSLGPLQRTLFPYEFHFRAVNTHLLINSPLTGSVEADRSQVIEALRRGCGFIGYDLPADTRGFHFTAAGYEQNAQMGDEIGVERGVTLQTTLPQSAPPAAECRLVRHGQVVQQWSGRRHSMFITSEPGAYRVEVTLPFQGKRRGWIYSNPIYVRAK